jgi:hypothetical protein
MPRYTILRQPSDPREEGRREVLVTDTFKKYTLQSFRAVAFAAIVRKYTGNNLHHWVRIATLIEKGVWIFCGTPKEGCQRYQTHLRSVLGSLRYHKDHINRLLEGKMQPMIYCKVQGELRAQEEKAKFDAARDRKIAAYNRYSKLPRPFVAIVNGVPQAFCTHEEYLRAVGRR